MHNVRNKGHKWDSTSPAERLLSHKYTHVRSAVVGCSLTPPHGGARIPPCTLSQVTCCSLTPAPINAGHELPPSQSLDANRSINNRDHARGSFLSQRYWEHILVRAAQRLHTSVQTWRVALCTFAKNTPRPQIHPTHLILLVSPVCGQEDAVLLLGSLCQLPPLLLVLLLLRLWRSPPYNGRKRKKWRRVRKGFFSGKENIKSFTQSPSGKHHLWKKQPERENCSH